MFPGQSRQPRAAFIALGEMIVDAVLSHRRCSGRGRVLTTQIFPSITHPNHTSDTIVNTA